jgi:hypothetical protein
VIGALRAGMKKAVGLRCGWEETARGLLDRMMLVDLLTTLRVGLIGVTYPITVVDLLLQYCDGAFSES